MCIDVHLIWTGWRLLHLEKHETALTLFDYQWPYNQEQSQRNWGRHRVSRLNLYVSNVSKAGGCSVHVGRVEALNQTHSLAGCAGDIQIDGATLPLPTLATGHYVECTDVADKQSCRTFDSTGKSLSKVITGAAVANPDRRGSILAGAIDVTVHGTGRAELVIMEVSTSSIGPFDLHSVPTLLKIDGPSKIPAK